MKEPHAKCIVLLTCGQHQDDEALGLTEQVGKVSTSAVWASQHQEALGKTKHAVSWEV